MNYHKIEKTSVANGTGIRVVLWVSGCSLHCRGCQNPKTWDVNSGKPFDEESKKELFEALDKPYIQGITFSGGHPLENENIDEVYNLCKEIKEKFPTKDIWLYTGYQFEDINSYLIIKYIDVLVDGRYIDEQRDLTLKWCGSSNQRVIDVKKTLEENKIVLYN
jgi:anaerobic ribonucleoside-triphosphate reductase activating protein